MFTARRHFPSGTKVVAIPNGVRIPEVRIKPEVNRGRLMLAAVGRQVGWKRLDHLIRAVADPRLSTLVRLDVFGDSGSSEIELRALVRDLDAPVEFRGWTDSLSTELASYDLLVTAAVLEGFGRCVVDAAGAAVPAVVPNVGVGPELVVHGLTGLTYDPTTASTLTRVLVDVATGDRAELVAMGHRARVRARALYDPARCAAQYFDLLAHCQRPAGMVR